MKKLILATLLLASVTSAEPAYEVFNVPPFTDNQAPESVTKKSLRRDTIVEMDSFNVVVPKGWSFMAAGVSDKMTASLTATPTEDIDHDETYVGVNERRAPPSVTLEERAAKYKSEKKGWKL